MTPHHVSLIPLVMRIFIFSSASSSTLYTGDQFLPEVLSSKFLKTALKLPKMSEKLCIQWNDFKENVAVTFANLREEKDFTDVTLACEDRGGRCSFFLTMRCFNDAMFWNS